MSSEGLAGILGAPRGVLRGQEAMDLIAYGCSRWVSGGCVLVFLMHVYSVSWDVGGWVGGRLGGWMGGWVGGWVGGCVGGWVGGGLVKSSETRKHWHRWYRIYHNIIGYENCEIIYENRKTREKEKRRAETEIAQQKQTLWKIFAFGAFFSCAFRSHR